MARDEDKGSEERDDRSGGSPAGRRQEGEPTLTEVRRDGPGDEAGAGAEDVPDAEADRGKKADRGNEGREDGDTEGQKKVGEGEDGKEKAGKAKGRGERDANEDNDGDHDEDEEGDEKENEAVKGKGSEEEEGEGEAEEKGKEQMGGEAEGDEGEAAEAVAMAEAVSAAEAAPEDEPAEGILTTVVVWRHRRRLKREGRYLAKELRRILKSKHRRERIPREVVVEGLAAVAGLEAALKRRPFSSEGLANAIGRMEELVDGPLAFARKSTLREYVEAIAVAGIVALVLRFFVIQPFKIPSGSMIPTLEVGDHIFVNKFSYGLQVPFTKDPPRHFVRWGEPERGDVVVFIHRRNGQDFIKRVVAVGGDRIKVINEQIHLQRGGEGPWEKVPQRRLPGPCAHMDWNEHLGRWERVTHCTLLEETLGDHRYTVVHVEEPDRREMPDYPPVAEFRKTLVPVGLGFQPAATVVDPYLVPESAVFVMGDNRRNSTDSRALGEVGFIGRRYVRGRALLVWWSWGPDNSVRFSRIGSLVR
jgi:signal peptidase I